MLHRTAKCYQCLRSEDLCRLYSIGAFRAQWSVWVSYETPLESCQNVFNEVNHPFSHRTALTAFRSWTTRKHLIFSTTWKGNIHIKKNVTFCCSASTPNVVLGMFGVGSSVIHTLLSNKLTKALRAHVCFFPDLLSRFCLKPQRWLGNRRRAKMWANLKME